MGTQYFSTFITGFEKVVEKVLVDTLKDVEVNLLLDGLIAYSTTSDIDSVKKLKFINNTFLLIKKFDDLSNRPMDKMMKYALNKINFEKALNINISKKYRTFRVITSKENQLVSVNKSILSLLEEKIIKATHLKPNRSKPDVEFWFLSRREECGFFGMRLTKHPDFTKSLPKGELRPELAHFLCLVSEPKSADVFLDPFAGHGAIPHARTNYPYKQIIVSDNNTHLVGKLRKRLKNTGNISVSRRDAIKLEGLDDKSVDKIVTDPPWGHFFDKKNMQQFYPQVLDSFFRVLRKGGLVVILIGEKELFEKLLDEVSDKFRLMEKYDTLVSGHKASVYKIIKN